MPGANSIQFRALTMMAVLCAGPAAAQFDPGATMDLGVGYGQIALSQSIMNGTRQIEGTESAASAQTDRALRVYWRDSISREFRQEMVDALSRRFNISKPAAGKLIEDLNPIASFQEVTHKLGLNMFKVADLLTTYCVVSWEIVQGRKGSPAGIKSLNTKIRNSIGSQDSVLTSVRNLSDKENSSGWNHWPMVLFSTEDHSKHLQNKGRQNGHKSCETLSTVQQLRSVSI